MPAGKGIVQSRLKTASPGDRHRIGADPGIAGLATAIAEHDRRNAFGRRRHRVAVEQERTAEPGNERRQLRFNSLVVGAMRLAEAVVELLGTNCPAPEIAVLLRARRDDAEAATGPGAHP